MLAACHRVCGMHRRAETRALQSERRRQGRFAQRSLCAITEVPTGAAQLFREAVVDKWGLLLT